MNSDYLLEPTTEASNGAMWQGPIDSDKIRAALDEYKAPPKPEIFVARSPLNKEEAIAINLEYMDKSLLPPDVKIKEYDEGFVYYQPDFFPSSTK